VFFKLTQSSLVAPLLRNRWHGHSEITKKANTIRRMYAAGFGLEQIAVLVEWPMEQVQAVLAAQA
jgi:hypothetical protein